MRLTLALLVAVVTLFACCNETSAATESIRTKFVQKAIENQAPSTRLLRTAQNGGNGTYSQERRLQTKLPLSVVKDLLADASHRLSYFQAWREYKVDAKTLAKTLKLKTTQIQWLDDLLNRSKKDQVELLKKYSAFLGV